MPYEFYKILHIIGFISLFSSIGFSASFYFVSQNKIDFDKKKIFFFMAPLHGISLLIIFVSGFGLLAKLGIHSSWLFYTIKLTIWVILGIMLYLFRKIPAKSNLLFLVSILLGIIAGTVGLIKI